MLNRLNLSPDKLSGLKEDTIQRIKTIRGNIHTTSMNDGILLILFAAARSFWKPTFVASVEVECAKGQVVAFESSDYNEEGICVNENYTRIYGYKIALYVLSHDINGKCDWTIGTTAKHHCDVAFQPPYLEVLDRQVWLPATGNNNGPDNHNGWHYATDFHECLTKRNEISKCPAFSLYQRFHNTHQPRSRELEAILHNKWTFWDVEITDRDDAIYDPVNRNRHAQRLSSFTGRFHRFNLPHEPCVQDCDRIAIDYVVEFSFMLEPLPEGRLNETAIKERVIGELHKELEQLAVGIHADTHFQI